MRVRFGVLAAFVILASVQSRVLPKTESCGASCGPCSADKPIIIIGAGICGLATAYHLKQAGCTNVVVLEARDRIGGRMITENRTFTNPKTGVDTEYVLHLGANWVHGENNPIWDLNQKQNFFPTQWLPRTYINIPTFGTNITNPEGNDTYVPGHALRKEYDEWVMQTEYFSDWLQASIDGRYDVPDLPYSYYMEEFMEHKNMTGAERDDFLLFVAVYQTSMDGDDLFRIGLANMLAADRGFDREHMVGWPGYNVINHFLAQGVRVELGQEVTTVEWTQASDTTQAGVKVVTAGGQIFEGSAVLVTVPLGAMKKHIVTFVPDLPNWMWHAIDNIGVALLDHIYLLWDEAWWPNYDALWKPKPKENNMGKCTASEWYNIHNLKIGTIDNSTMAPLLLSLPAGLFGQIVETMDDEQVKETFVAELQSMFPNTTIPEATLIRTNWLKDRYTFGAYSSPEVGADPLSISFMGQDIGNVLFFGGEHTSVDRWGYVDGAYLAGQREAEKLLKACCRTAFDGSADPHNPNYPSNHNEIRKQWAATAIKNLNHRFPGFEFRTRAIKQQ